MRRRDWGSHFRQTAVVRQLQFASRWLDLVSSTDRSPFVFVLRDLSLYVVRSLGCIRKTKTSIIVERESLEAWFECAFLFRRRRDVCVRLASTVGLVVGYTSSC